MSSTQPTVCLVESLGFLEEQTHREGEIITRTLQLSGKRSDYIYIRTVDELRAVAREFGESEHRYFHLSCHGAVDAKGDMVGFALTTGSIATDELAHLLAPHVAGRRVFLSSCLAARSNFARTILEHSNCLSVLAPVNKIRFDDAAIFWTAFYHLMFKGPRASMTTARIKENVEICSALVKERFRLFHQDKERQEIRELTIGPLKRPAGRPKA